MWLRVVIVHTQVSLFFALHSKFNCYRCTLVVTAGISCKPVPEEILKPKDAPAPETSGSGVLLTMQEIKTEDLLFQNKYSFTLNSSA